MALPPLDDVPAKPPALPNPTIAYGGVSTMSLGSCRQSSRLTLARAGDLHLYSEPRQTSFILHVEGRKEPKKVARRSLFFLHAANPFRFFCLRIVESKWCDRVVLFCIALNSVLLALEKHRAPHSDMQNEVQAVIANVLSGIFTAECFLKIIGWGFRLYISDSWNVLDFVVVISAIIEWIPFIPFGGLGFLRLFRVLRPLRSLNSVPEMKVLVNTTVGAVPRLSNVAALGVFIFLVFAIVGVTLMPGIFYRECHVTERPELIFNSEIDTHCWEWLKVGDGKLCGGEYDCTHTEDELTMRLGFCGGHELDSSSSVRPVFDNVLDSKGPLRGGFDWCSNDSRPTKVAPELDFIHFDHLAGAFLLIFQCMTMEGWTDIMYYVKDSFSFWFAVLFFFLMIVVTSHFLLNVALAVVDEARNDFDGDNAEEEESADGSEAGGGDEEELESEDAPWSDSSIVSMAKWLTETQPWQNFILFIITANVLTMMMSKFPPDVVLEEILEHINRTFLGIFVFEMLLEITARGPIGYCKNVTTAFDGFVVVISLVETGMIAAEGGGGGSALQALRTLRLFRVLNKFASRNPKIAVLLKSMLGTAQALRFWLVLFVLVLFICTLMWMHFFANTLHFDDPDDLGEWTGSYQTHDDETTLVPWCETEVDTPLQRVRGSWHHRQDCIPRAHFDNFGWAFVTIFQIMTGENWNAVMYAGMRASRHNNWEWAFGILYVLLLLFGQILFLSLFLSMLLDRFNTCTKDLTKQQEKREERSSLRRQRSVRTTSDSSGPGGPWASFSSRASFTASSGTAALDRMKDVFQHSKSKKTAAIKLAPDGTEIVDDTAIPSRPPWPRGWSWFLMPPDFPFRVVANDILERQANIRGMKFNIFETVILGCILVSTVCMMIDFPLANPDNTIIKTVRVLDTFFACIFIGEMVVKLSAWPVFWGEGAYLWSEGCAWNWLDFIVVAVSVMGLIGGGPSGLKTLRILRAFRPLRVVKRMETLRTIVEAIFSSLKELGVLLIVFLLFLLIFALVFSMYLGGTLYGCSETNIWFHRDVGDTDYASFTMPLCLSAQSLASVQVKGQFSETSRAWNASLGDVGQCGAGLQEGFEIPWMRASPDTPICVARCDPFFKQPFNSTYAAPGNLCPRPYATAEELPHACSEKAANLPNRPLYSEDVGQLFIEKMQASYVLPCGGSTAQQFQGKDTLASGAGWGDGLSAGSLDQSWADAMGTPPERLSCRRQFCPKVDPSRVKRCEHESKIHPHFCMETCKKGENSPKCQSCREEFRAACECPDFCTPLVKDAALCVEQGGAWEQVLSQNFDNVFNAMLALVEISTTEGWVDAMYAACDTNFGPYMQPLRDTNHPIWMFMFVLWILLSFMFLMNLGVGVIVDKFLEMRDEGKDFISPAQMRWIKSRLSLSSRAYIFNLENLHTLPSFRRQVYDITEHVVFERVIMGCIILNTIMMALVTFPELETPDTHWWRTVVQTSNYIFASVFFVEACLKLMALRSSYFKDSWNCFDFTCVLATVAGTFVTIMDVGIDISSVASVIRIFRIARLFKLLKFKALRPLNKLFRSLAISLVKLANVGVVAFLFLILFSILGVNVFSAVSSSSDTHNEHGNFRHFINAFITLFRASTGEAWNEIMHDLSKDQGDWFKEGSWCTPAALFDTETKYQVLKDKCLIDNPNACVVDVFTGFAPMPWLYWVSYTLFMGLVIMNVVIAVILEGYNETKSSDEVAIIETCRCLWGTKYDPDHKMRVTFPEACRFIVEAIGELQRDGSIEGEKIDIEIPHAASVNSCTGVDLSRFPLKFAMALDITPRPYVSFEEATKQVVRFAAVVEEPGTEVVEELNACDHSINTKETKKLKMLEMRKKDAEELLDGRPLFQHIAAMMVQRMAREALARFRKRRARNRGSGDDEDEDEKKKLETAKQRKFYVKCVARAMELGSKIGVSAPVAG